MELIQEVEAELADGEYSSRTHGKVSTYMWGCRGPLCKKAHRDYRRLQYRKRAAQLGAVPQEMAPRKERENDALLELLQAKHEQERRGRTAAAS